MAVEVRVGENGLESRHPRREKAALSYETASGPTNFLNRDPIEEQGGLNLYAFVGNDPVNFIDYLGKYTLCFGYRGTPWFNPNYEGGSWEWSEDRDEAVRQAKRKRHVRTFDRFTLTFETMVVEVAVEHLKTDPVVNPSGLPDGFLVCKPAEVRWEQGRSLSWFSGFRFMQKLSTAYT